MPSFLCIIRSVFIGRYSRAKKSCTLCPAPFKNFFFLVSLWSCGFSPPTRFGCWEQGQAGFFDLVTCLHQFWYNNGSQKWNPSFLFSVGASCGGTETWVRFLDIGVLLLLDRLRGELGYAYIYTMSSQRYHQSFLIRTHSILVSSFSQSGNKYF